MKILNDHKWIWEIVALIRRGPLLPSKSYRPSGRGPLLNRRDRLLAHRNGSKIWAKSALPILIAGLVGLWVQIIGPELRAHSGHEQLTVTQAVKPGGPQAAATPQVTTRKGRGKVSVRPVSVGQVMLRVAKDHVARRVIATVGSVPDLEAMKGADVDMVERALHAAHFELRDAIIRHRFRAFRTYGLRKRPQPGAALRKRVLTKRALTVFLEAFAQRLGVDCDVTGEAGFMPGDVVLVSRPRRRGQLKQFAIVSDRTDPQGISLLITLDPGDKVAREAHSLSRYEVVSHYRLSRADLVHVAASLAMTNPSDSSRLL